MHNSNPESKSNPLQRRLPPGIAEVVAGWDDIFRQMEKDGCPPTISAHIKEQFQVALAETLEESKQRDSLFSEVRRHIQKLKPERLHSGPPPGSASSLNEIERLASELPDEAEKQLVLRRVEQLRGCLPEGCGR